MTSKWFLRLAAILVCTPINLASAQDWAREKLENSPRHGEWVVIEQGDRHVDAFIMFPEVADKATAVVVIHEIFGLTDWVRGVADDLAKAGYIAICPDLLSGMGPDGGNTESFSNVEGARRAIGSLPPDQITDDLNATVQFVSELPAANGKVAVIGFCWGGSQTFRFATNNSKIIAAIPFYGSGPTDAAAIGRIKAPVFGFYGGNDARVNATIPASVKLMNDADKKFDVTNYDGAGHGFLRAGEAPDAESANKEARSKALIRIVEILKDH